MERRCRIVAMVQCLGLGISYSRPVDEKGSGKKLNLLSSTHSKHWMRSQESRTEPGRYVMPIVILDLGELNSFLVAMTEYLVDVLDYSFRGLSCSWRGECGRTEP